MNFHETSIFLRSHGPFPWSIPMVPMVSMVPMAPDAATLLLTEGGAKGTARGLGHLGQDMADGDSTTQPRDITYII